MTDPVSALPPDCRECFNDIALAGRNLDALQQLASKEQSELLLHAACKSFDPDRALNNFERFIRLVVESKLTAVCDRFSLLLFQRLAAAFSASQYLTNLLMRRPALAAPLADDAYLKTAQPPDLLQLMARGQVLSEETTDGRFAALRQFRHSAFLRIGLRDLLGYAPVPEILGEISAVADAAMQVAYEMAVNEAEPRYGSPEDIREDGTRIPSRFAIIGLGKLGGGELNFSSDIDILYCYSSDDGETTGSANSEHMGAVSVSTHEYYNFIGRRITAALRDETADGRVFRVDLRLRPEGSQGALCYSLHSCEVYYQTWGENWERQALIKARHCAGDASLGNEFCEMVQPFIYRKSLDYEAIEEIRQVKERIDETLTARGQEVDNVKLGYGGIREIEFVVQAFQMIYGGQDADFRSRSTLATLETLWNKRILPGEEVEGLIDAYRFLRKLENRIQLADDRQLYRLPEQSAELCSLARQMGYADDVGTAPETRLKAAYARHQDAVRKVYDNLFYVEEEDAAPTLVFLAEKQESLQQHLESVGFRNGGHAFRLLLEMRDGKGGERATSLRHRKQFDQISPLLVNSMAESPDPDLALVNLIDFVAASGASQHWLEVLENSQQLTKLLLQLFGSSRFLAQRLIRYPGDIDLLLNPAVWQVRTDADGYQKELETLLAACADRDARILELRKFKRSAELHIAMRSLAETVKPDEMFQDLSALADACLQVAVDMAHAELRPTWGWPGSQDSMGRWLPVDLVVLGAGKLGGNELDFGSDLDVILLYDKEGETWHDGDGPKPPKVGKTNFEYFAAFYQNFREIVSEATPAGPGYELDLRLRPEGKNGPFICPLDLFGRYYYHRAELWEIQMLSKTRFCAGNEALAEKVERIIRSIRFSRTLTPEDIKNIEKMRQRLEKELAQETETKKDIKRGYGGITDIEFIAQLLQMRYGRRFTTFWGTGTIEVLRAARRLEIVTSDDADILMDAYRFLRRIEHALRIVDDKSIHTFDSTPAGFSNIARRLGYRDTGQSATLQIAEDYAQHTSRVREIFGKVFKEEARRCQEENSQ
jgi:[glutamine synthetase] adenylyltransferase / [glutamine synthetase]-adenylyl-L-tyrosine phosphorylase